MAWPVSDRQARMAGMTADTRGRRSWLLSGDFGRFWGCSMIEMAPSVSSP
jgi:hypothetical protein